MSKTKIFLILIFVIAAIFFLVPLFSDSSKQYEEYNLTITADHCDVQVWDSKNKPVDVLLEDHTYTIKITPETGYEVKAVYNNLTKLSSLEIKPVADVYLRVETAIKTYNVNVALGPAVVLDKDNNEVTSVTHFESYTITAPCDGYRYYHLNVNDTLHETDIVHWTCDGSLYVRTLLDKYVTTTLSFAFKDGNEYLYDANHSANYVETFNSTDLVNHGFTLPDNYRFLGWATEPDSSTITYEPFSDFVIPFGADPYILYAVIEPIYYTVNYWSMDGSTLLDTVSTHGPSEQTCPEYTDYMSLDEGYYFAGWRISPVMTEGYGLMPGDSFTLDRDLNYYASYRKHTASLYLYQKAGEHEFSEFFGRIVYGEDFTLPLIDDIAAITYEGFYNFLGWDTDESADTPVYSDGQTISIKMTSGADIYLYAIWDPIVVTLELYAPDETTLLYSSEFEGIYQSTTLPAYSSLVDVEVGKYFYNWRQLNGLNYYQDCATVGMSVDISLAAVLQDVTYLVSLKTTTIVDDGTDEPIINAIEYTMPTCTYGQSYTLPLATTLTPFVKDGYALIGWDTDSSADTVVYADGSNFVNLTTTHNDVITLWAVYEVVSTLPSHSKTFSENTAEQVSGVSAYIAENNLTTQEVYDTFGWSLGDTLPMTVGDLERNVAIIGFNHDTKTDGTGKAGITLVFTRPITTTTTSSMSCAGMENQCLSTLPEEWQSVLIPVDKKVIYKGGISTKTVTTYSSKLFQLSYKELVGCTVTTSYMYLEGTQYEGFTFGDTSFDRVKFIFESGGAWLRTATSSSNKYCFITNTAFSSPVLSSESQCTLCPAFCV